MVKTIGFNSLKLRYKIVIPLLLVMLLLFVAIIIITIYAQKKTYDYNTEKLIETKISEINRTVDQVAKKALYIASISSKMEIVLQAYQEYYSSSNLKKASSIIETQFKSINKIIYENTGYEPRIHFHLPPAISFCRCWSDVRGDDISPFRNSVLKVSREHTFVKGIETGRGGLVIRGIAPIFSPSGEYYGSVEAFFNINQLLKEININTNEEFAVFMYKDLIKIATNYLEDRSTNIKKEKQIIDDYILVEKTKMFQLENIQNLPPKPDLQKNSGFEQDNYKYAIIPLNNIFGQIEGIGILQIDISDYRKSLRDVIIFEFILFFFLIITVVFVLSGLSNRYIIKKIKSADLALQKLSRGELTDKIIVQNDDEIGNMQKSLNLLSENRKKNTQFALEIGSGNLKTEYSVISKSDLLGNALAEMQRKLIRYSGETTKALEKSRQSEEKFKNLSNLTFEGILIHDKGIVIDVNRSFLEMFNYELQELTGKNAIQLLIPKKHHQTIYDNIIKNQTLPYEIEGIKKDGSIFPLEIEARNIIKRKEIPSNRVTAFRDISFRKKAEAEIKKLSTAVEQSANTVIITDTEGNVEYTNPKFSELTGYSSQEALGQNPRFLNAGTQAKKYYEELWHTITGGKIWKGEFHNKKKNGNLFWEQVTITPIKNEAGKTINYLAIKEDITERKKTVKELIIAKEKAEESDQLKTEFLHNMSHEVRTPMNGILGFSKLLNLPGKTDQQKVQYTQIIQNSSLQLLRIINDILEISRLVTKQVIVKNESINLNGLLSELHAGFEIKAKEKQLAVYLKKGFSDQDSMVVTDKTILNTILENLLENALKFTEKGFVEIGYILVEKRHRVRPSADALSLQDKTIHLYVKDSGIGIDPVKQKTIFDRFSQEEKDISQKTGGLGLGLSIALESAKLLNGTITIKSEKGKGATFFVTIPYNSVSLETENLQIS